MNILLTGIDGYLGWPTALKLSKEFPDARIVGIDNLARRKWVMECGSISAIPVPEMDKRIAIARENGFTNIDFVKGDLVDRDFVYQTLRIFMPEVVIHVAAQPSAPYSHINGERANFTQFNNNQSTRNLLWGLKETGLTDTHFIETTTTGVYGAPNFKIPEGFIDVQVGKDKDRIPYPGMAGSWYHMSKATDINNLYLANKLWNFSITDLRTAIIYGAQTEETSLDPLLSTRFDFDFFFGVVIHRFCAMVLTGYPLMVYGKGEQKKPVISLEDATSSVVAAVRSKQKGKFKVYNQCTETVSIINLAAAIKNAAEKIGIDAVLKNIPNPRVEKEDHKMEIANEGFLGLIGNPKQTVETGMRPILNILTPFRDTIVNYKDRFLPDELKK
ncbi:NAD-dependent epimerase/dehydratase family protein [Thermodesulfobacteriota bacterium]